MKQTYRQKLDGIIAGYFAKSRARGDEPLIPEGSPPNRLDAIGLNQDMTLTDEGARRLHEEICREEKMTADQIIKDWNKKSPEDDQW